MIVRSNQAYGDRAGVPAAYQLEHLQAGREGRPVRPMPTKSGPVTVDAYVNQGRWVGDCRCGASQFVDPDDRRFYCGECGNRDVDGLWAKLRAPKFAADVEQILGRRPDPVTRNWRPGETAAELADENRLRGIA